MAVMAAVLVAPLAAQNVPDSVPPVPDTVAAEPGPTPRGAFLRAVAFPAWGHVYIDEPVRGGVFFTLQSASYFMLFKTLARLAEAEHRRDVAAGIAADSLRRRMETDSALAELLSDPLAFEEAVAGSERVEARQDLVDSRTRHRQDWFVYTATFTFASAVDAYVAAHLKGFPDFDVTPAANGAVRLRLSFPTGPPR
jgi:hypothetical protein